MSKHQISKVDFEKYKRQIVLDEVGTEGQLLLANSKVLVIGAGGLSSPILQVLAGAGIGTIGVIDFDKVSLSNIHRQLIYTTEDVGLTKTEAASKRLMQINPDCTILPYEFRIDESNALKLIEKYDLVIDGSDSFATRYLVNDACVILNKPLVFGAVYKFIGQVSVFNHEGGPTYRCAFPEVPEQTEIPDCSTIGVLGSLTGIIGNFMANEALKIIIRNDNVLSGKLMHFDTLTYAFDLIDIEKDDENSKITELGTYGDITCEMPEVKYLTANELDHLLQSEEEVLVYNLKYATQTDDLDFAQSVNTEDLLLGKLPIPDDRKIVIVCDYGIQSESIAEYIQQTYQKENIYSLKDGLLAYKAK